MPSQLSEEVHLLKNVEYELHLGPAKWRYSLAQRLILEAVFRRIHHTHTNHNHAEAQLFAVFASLIESGVLNKDIALERVDIILATDDVLRLAIQDCDSSTLLEDRIHEIAACAYLLARIHTAPDHIDRLSKGALVEDLRSLKEQGYNFQQFVYKFVRENPNGSGLHHLERVDWFEVHFANALPFQWKEVARPRSLTNTTYVLHHGNAKWHFTQNQRWILELQFRWMRHTHTDCFNMREQLSSLFESHSDTEQSMNNISHEIDNLLRTQRVHGNPQLGSVIHMNTCLLPAPIRMNMVQTCAFLAARSFTVPERENEISSVDLWPPLSESTLRQDHALYEQLKHWMDSEEGEVVTRTEGEGFVEEVNGKSKFMKPTLLVKPEHALSGRNIVFRWAFT